MTDFVEMFRHWHFHVAAHARDVRARDRYVGRELPRHPLFSDRSTLLRDGQPFVESDPKCLRLAKFCVPAHRDTRVDPFDEFTLRVAGVAHVDEVVVSAVTIHSIAPYATWQRETVKCGALHSDVQQFRSRAVNKLVEGHVAECD